MDSAGFQHSRRAVLRLAAAAGARVLSGHTGIPDAIFSTIPFPDWLAKGDHADLDWSTHISGSELSNYQRLWVHVSVGIGGSELAARRDHGKLIALIQFTDARGVHYRTHKALDLKNVAKDGKPPDLAYTQDVFVRPGDYRVALALFDAKTHDYNLALKSLHVPPLKHDALPDAWRDLPLIEFPEDTDPPDSWFLPSSRCRLNLPLKTPNRARVTVLVNLTGSERAARYMRASRHNLETLIPALRVLSEIDVKNGSLDIVLLDLARRRVAFRQNDVRSLDWLGLKAALAAADNNLIDVHSLEHRKQNAQFFTREVKHLLSAPGETALIVLSGPMIFSAGENLRPLRMEPDCPCNIFYIRYHSWFRRPLSSSFFEQAGARRPSNAAPIGFGLRAQLDELEHTLSPLKPRLFDVAMPEQFRKALAGILLEISNL